MNNAEAHQGVNWDAVVAKRGDLQRLLPVTSVPWYDGEVVSGVLAFLDDLLARIPTFELEFRPSTEVADLVEELVQSSPEQQREA